MIENQTDALMPQNINVHPYTNIESGLIMNIKMLGKNIPVRPYGINI